MADLDEMSGTLQYCTFDGSYTDLSSMTWEQISSGKEVYELNDGFNFVSGETFVPITISGSDYYTVAINMKKSSGNQYQLKTCDLEVNLYAVQGNAPI